MLHLCCMTLTSHGDLIATVSKAIFESRGRQVVLRLGKSTMEWRNNFKNMLLSIPWLSLLRLRLYGIMHGGCQIVNLCNTKVLVIPPIVESAPLTPYSSKRKKRCIWQSCIPGCRLVLPKLVQRNLCYIPFLPASLALKFCNNLIWCCCE